MIQACHTKARDCEPLIALSWSKAWHRYQLRQLSEVLDGCCEKELVAALSKLRDQGHIYRKKEMATGGRSAERWFARDKGCEQSELSEQSTQEQKGAVPCSNGLLVCGSDEQVFPL